MIEKEELIDALTELMGGDLSEGAIGYIADDLMEKFVMFERPDVGVVVESADGSITMGGNACPRFTVSRLEAWKKESASFAKTDILKLLEARALLEHYRSIADAAKAKRREELSKEIGGSRFDALPPMIQKLVIRLVEAESKNDD